MMLGLLLLCLAGVIDWPAPPAGGTSARQAVAGPGVEDEGERPLSSIIAGRSAVGTMDGDDSGTPPPRLLAGGREPAHVRSGAIAASGRLAGPSRPPWFRSRAPPAA